MNSQNKPKVGKDPEEEVKVDQINIKKEIPEQKPPKQPDQKPKSVEKVYPDDVKDKARALKEIFPETCIDKFYELVQNNSKKTLNELIEIALSL